MVGKSPKPEFEELCKTAILEGWTPFCGIAFIQVDLPKTNEGTMLALMFAQAFVKYE